MKFFTFNLKNLRSLVAAKDLEEAKKIYHDTVTIEPIDDDRVQEVDITDAALMLDQ